MHNWDVELISFLDTLYEGFVSGEENSEVESTPVWETAEFHNSSL